MCSICRLFAPVFVAGVALTARADIIPITLDQSQITDNDVNQQDWNGPQFPFDHTISSSSPATADLRFQNGMKLTAFDVAGVGGDGFTSEAAIVGFEFGQLVSQDSQWDVNYALIDSSGTVLVQGSLTFTQVFPHDVDNIGFIYAVGGGTFIPPDSSIEFAGVRVDLVAARDPAGNDMTLDIDALSVGFRADFIHITPAPASIIVLTALGGTLASGRRRRMSCNCEAGAI